MYKLSFVKIPNEEKCKKVSESSVLEIALYLKLVNLSLLWLNCKWSFGKNRLVTQCLSTNSVKKQNQFPLINIPLNMQETFMQLQAIWLHGLLFGSFTRATDYAHAPDLLEVYSRACLDKPSL